jgi:hypothetical protein
MTTTRTIRRALAFGAIAEFIALAVTFGLYALKQGREPMEWPFNWTATVLQMPGVIVADRFGWRVDYSAWCQWGIIFCVQAMIWSAIGFVFLTWRARKTT